MKLLRTSLDLKLNNEMTSLLSSPYCSQLYSFTSHLKKLAGSLSDSESYPLYRRHQNPTQFCINKCQKYDDKNIIICNVIFSESSFIIHRLLIAVHIIKQINKYIRYTQIQNCITNFLCKPFIIFNLLNLIVIRASRKYKVGTTQFNREVHF